MYEVLCIKTYSIVFLKYFFCQGKVKIKYRVAKANLKLQISLRHPVGSSFFIRFNIKSKFYDNYKSCACFKNRGARSALYIPR